MNDWKRLIEAGHELARAHNLLDHLDAASCTSQARISAGEALLRDAQAAVNRANCLMGRA